MLMVDVLQLRSLVRSPRTLRLTGAAAEQGEKAS